MKIIREPLEKFIRLESSSSILLFLVTVSALVLANSSLSESFLGLWKNYVSISIPGLEISKPLVLWINDGLMAIFFFLIGLEIKREIVSGELSHMKKASLPFFAAIGGMVVPATLFVFLNKDQPGIEGWGIPMAADIAFALGILRLLGNKVPSGLKVFLMAFAIIDDLGAVLVIAFFYSSNLIWSYIGIGIAIVAVLILLSYRGVYSKYLFFSMGVVVWVLFLKSGIHATIAGVLMALTIPLQRKTDTNSFYESGKEALKEFKNDCRDQQGKTLLTQKQLHALDNLEVLTDKTTPPLQHLEHNLHGWVSYLIMPVFALANAGVVFAFAGNENLGLAINIAISMVVGNVVGIFSFSWLSIKLKLSELPQKVTILQLAGVSLLGGLGFTMSLFINSLAYTDQVLIDAAKMGILIGSLIAGILGFVALKFILNKEEK